MGPTSSKTTLSNRVSCIAFLILISACLILPFHLRGQSIELGSFVRASDSLGTQWQTNGLIPFGSSLVFSANDGAHGEEIWISDGTTAGTFMIKDLRPGEDGSNPTALTLFNGEIYFGADLAGFNQFGLWKTDGTENGTVLVKTFDGASGNLKMAAWNGSLYLSGSATGEGHELWISDGTTGGTQVLKVINPGFGSSNPGDFVGTANHLFFVANDGTNGEELWTTDGTAGNTVLLKDINPQTFGTNPDNMTLVGNTLFFTANNGTTGEELWKSDGTNLGTQLVKDIRSGSSGSSISQIVAYNGKAYFYANDNISGLEIWSSDGTANGTVILKDIRPTNSSANGGDLGVWNNTLFFGHADGELWKSDGTTQGTVLVKDLLDSAGSSSGGPRLITPYSGGIIFEAFGDVGGTGEAWISDGTAAGTQLLKDIRPSFVHGFGVSNFTTVGSTVFFIANDGIHDQELWATDGTEAGTRLVRDVQSMPRLTTSVIGDDGNFYFSASNGSDGMELWKSGGTANTTAQITDIEAGPEGSDPEELTSFAGSVFFGTDGDLWKTDGTAVGTTPVKNVSASFGIEQLTVAGPDLFFTGSFGELWKSDGTTPGTNLVSDQWTFSPNHIVPVGNSVFFLAADPTSNRELWKSDGTGAGTVQVVDLMPGSSGAFGNLSNRQLHPFGNGVLMGADDGNGAHTELWISDGTAGGTVLVKDAGLGANTPLNFLTVGSQVYYSTFHELWKTDGTTAGTTAIKNFNNERAEQLTLVGGLVFFVVDSNTYGKELWITDGTDPGTVLVKDIFPGMAGSNPTHLKEVGNKLYFQANDGVHGVELWVSDGTGPGTRMVEDFAPGNRSSWPTNLTEYNSMLLFIATDNLDEGSLRLLDDETIRINEVDAFTQSSDSLEFIELTDGGVGNTPCDDLVVVLFDGGTDQSYAAFDLDTLSTDGNGFLVLGNSGVPGGVDVSFANGTLVNTPGAVALYRADAADFPNGTPVTTTNLIDVVVYTTGGEAEDPGLTVLLDSGGQLNEGGAGNTTNHSLQRIPNGGGFRLQSQSFLTLDSSPRLVNSLPSGPTIPDLSSGSDSGVSDADNITNVTTPTLSGFAPPGSTINLVSNLNGAIGSTVASGSGAWSVVTSALSNGSHQVTATDGNETSAPLTLVIDNAAPAAPNGLDLASSSDTGRSNSDNNTMDDTPQISGNGENGGTVTVFVDSNNAGTTTVSGVSWSLVLGTLAEGTRQITAVVEDIAGNQSPVSNALAIVIDQTSPAAPSLLDLINSSDTGTSNTDDLTNDTTPTISGAGENNATITLLEGGLSRGSTVASGAWSITSSFLAEGQRTFTATATDAAGNPSGVSAPLTIDIDTTPPAAPTQLDLAAGSDTGISNSDDITNDSSPQINGEAVPGPGDRIVLFDFGSQVGNIAATGTWSVTPGSLGHGNHRFTATMRDAAGNDSAHSSPLDVVIDLNAPTVAIIRDVGQAETISAGPANFVATFSEGVFGFSGGSVSVGGSSGGSGVSVGGSSPNFTIAINTVGQEGSLFPVIPLNAATDEAGNGNIASTLGDSGVSVDSVGGTVGNHTEVVLNAGTGSATGWLSNGDTDLYSFVLTETKRFRIETTGSVDTVGTLMDESETILNSVASDDDAGTENNFRIISTEEAGTYYVEVSKKGNGPPGSYQLDIVILGDPGYQPDVRVDKTPALTIGNDIYLPTIQRVSILARNARATNAYFGIENDGDVSDEFVITSRKGNRLFKLIYFDAEANITSAVVAGTHNTGTIETGETYTIRTRVKPVKRLFKKRSPSGRVTYRKKKLTINLGATSVASSDGDSASALIIVK